LHNPAEEHSEAAGPEARQEACAVCGALFPLSTLAGTSRGLLCPFCLAEEQACGCED